MLIPSTPPTVNTSWASIRHLTDRDIDPPYAHLRPEAAEHLTYALAQGGDPLCWFALWKGYAEVLQEQSPVPAPPPDLVDLIRTPIESTASLEQIYLASQARYKVLLPHRFVSFSPECFVTIQADETVPYKEVVSVINAASGSSLKVVLATRAETDQPTTPTTR